MPIVWMDSGIIGLITNPYKQGESADCERWLLGLSAKGICIVSSVLCDYEVRRNLILESKRTGNRDSLNNLDELTDFVSFLSVSDKSLKCGDNYRTVCRSSFTYVTHPQRQD